MNIEEIKEDISKDLKLLGIEKGNKITLEKLEEYKKTRVFYKMRKNTITAMLIFFYYIEEHNIKGYRKYVKEKGLNMHRIKQHLLNKVDKL